MERPKVNQDKLKRHVTGEIVYLNEMRRLGQIPGRYEEQSDRAIQMYETEASLCEATATKPQIMDEFERFDDCASEAVLSCVTLADELLKLKSDNGLSFVDCVVHVPAKQVLATLQSLRAGSILASDDEQLAIASDGSYYPVLDIKKKDVQLEGIGLRIWGWDDHKVVYTNREDEQYDYRKHVLVYPSDEKSARRELEIQFSYSAAGKKSVAESIRLSVDSTGRASIGSNIYVSAYAETGYEGHGGQMLGDCEDSDVAAFGDLVAEIVGDVPESIGMMIDRDLQDLQTAATTDDARCAVQRLIALTWPAQARYILRQPLADDRSLADRLCDQAAAAEAVTMIDSIIEHWNRAR